MKTAVQKSDLIVFSLNRWDSTYTRTSQIMSRFARYRSVYFFEAPIFGISKEPLYLLRETRDDVVVVEPYLSSDMSVADQKTALVDIINKLITDEKITEYTIWSDTPKVMPMIRDLKPRALIYDCIANYAVTHPELEKEMLDRADVVLTSGHALYGAKHNLNSNIHNIPDSVDYRHFYQARMIDEEPEDQSSIPHPRIGFAGDIDQNIDLELLKNLADLRPNWHFVLAGEVRGLDPETLPKRDNIHYLSQKGYSKIPIYISSWDCTFLPYKVNEETQFLNATLIQESLIGGCPVVSVPLKDVRTIYENQNLIHIAEFPHDYIGRLEYAMTSKDNSVEWLEMIDKNFKGMSWERSCVRIAELEQDIYSMKIQTTLQETLKDLFNKTFTRKLVSENPWIHGINLKKIQCTRSVLF